MSRPAAGAQLDLFGADGAPLVDVSAPVAAPARRPKPPESAESTPAPPDPARKPPVRGRRTRPREQSGTQVPPDGGASADADLAAIPARCGAGDRRARPRDPTSPQKRAPWDRWGE